MASVHRFCVCPAQHGVATSVPPTPFRHEILFCISDSAPKLSLTIIHSLHPNFRSVCGRDIAILVLREIPSFAQDRRFFCRTQRTFRWRCYRNKIIRDHRLLGAYVAWTRSDFYFKQHDSVQRKAWNC